MPKLRKMLGDVNDAGCTALMRAMETQSKETLLEVSRENEPNPAKLQWNC